MLRIVVVPFASPLHGRDYCAGLMEVLRKWLRGHDVAVEGIVEDEEGVESVGRKYRDAFPIAVALTGGTGRLIRRLVEVGAFDKLVVFGHGEHNSLASAISARAKLETEGINVWLYHCPELHDPSCKFVVDEMMRVSYAVANVLNSRIAIVGVEEKSEEVSNFESAFGAEAKVMTFDELMEEVEKVREEDAKQFANDVGPRLGLDPGDKALLEVGKLYVALKNIFVKEKVIGLGIDCFRYIQEKGIAPCIAVAKLNEEGFVTACEADAQSLLLMIVSYSLTGTPGWMANACSFCGNKAFFAHCTASLSLLEEPKAVTHFESGKPYAVTGRLRTRVFTVVSVSRDFSMLTTALARIERSGLLSDSMCRIAALADFGTLLADRIPLVSPANHHVFIPGDVRKELRAVAELLGLDYASYEELIEVLEY